MKVAKQKSQDLAKLAQVGPDRRSRPPGQPELRIVRDKEKMRALWGSRLERWFPRGLDEPRNENVKIATLARRN